MILAAHQPHYLPWLGYFHKMARCDVFVYLDDVQFKKREFQNRNRIRVKEGALWLTVPVLTKGRYTQSINDVEIEKASDWSADHWTAIQQAYGKAPAFAENRGELAAFYGRSWEKLNDLCTAMSEWHRRALGIATPLRNSSEFKLTTTKSRRLLDLCLALGADTYLSGQGARDYLDEKMFSDEGVKVIYQEFHHPTYAQAYPGFESHLAALDVVLNHGRNSREILLA